MELERIFKENGGYFGEKKLWEIFEIKSSKKIFHAQELEILDNFKENHHPYVVRSALNNWIRGWVSKNENFLNEWNTLSFAQDTFSVFYQENPYFTGNKVKILKSKFNWMNNLSWIFLSSNLNKVLKNFSWWVGSTVETIWEIKFSVPLTKNWEIAFDYMEDYIRFLEAERIEELEAYLLATWLKDYNLTEKEQKALDRFEEMLTLDLIWSDLIWSDLIWSDRVNIAFRKFRIGDLFNVLWTKSLDSNAVEFLDEWVNFVWRTFENNWIQWKIARRDFEPNEPFSLTATVIWNYKYVKFQREEYYCSQNINKITPKENFFVWNKFIAYFVWTWIQKFVSLYDWQQWGYKLDDIKSTELLIPTLNWQIDFEFMENFIRAVEKLVIKDLVIWNEKKMNAYREVISKKNFK